MESRTKFLGHPIHPMLIVFPLGLLATAVVFDILYVATGNADLATFSFFALIAGIIGGLLAAVFGLLDWMAVPKGTRARRIGAIHGVGNVVVVGLFALSLFMRWGEPAYLPNVMPLVFALLGAALALFTAWLGGELVYRLRVAVDDDADLDASNSISREGIAQVRT
jgi:uncharacterized membrane protein